MRPTLFGKGCEPSDSTLLYEIPIFCILYSEFFTPLSDVIMLMVRCCATPER